MAPPWCHDHSLQPQTFGEGLPHHVALCSGGFGVGRKGRGKGLSLLCVTVRGREGGLVRGQVKDGTQPEQEFIRESDCANISPSPESLEVLGVGSWGLGGGWGDIPQNLVWGLVLFKGNMFQDAW